MPSATLSFERLLGITISAASIRLEVRISRTTTAIPAMRARWIGGLEHVGLGREGLEETDPLLGEGDDVAALGNTYSTFVASD